MRSAGGFPVVLNRLNGQTHVATLLVFMEILLQRSNIAIVVVHHWAPPENRISRASCSNDRPGWQSGRFASSRTGIRWRLESLRCPASWATMKGE